MDEIRHYMETYGVTYRRALAIKQRRELWGEGGDTMLPKLYSPEQMAEAVTMMDAFAILTPEKRFLLSMMTKAFVAGMEAQEKMTERAGAARPGT